jgi:hypothetical protein
MRKRTFLFSLGALCAKPSFALYDPQPSDLLAPSVGAWNGTLTYADYQSPGKLVTLPARLVAALAGPAELSLYFVFDDGPGKTVYSYERMALDPVRRELTWTSGVSNPNTSKYRVISASADHKESRIEFDREVDSGVDAYTLEFTAKTWQLIKREVRAGKEELQRSRYDFVRA